MNKAEISAVIASIIGVVSLMILGPAIGFLLGWLGGFLVELILGNMPTDWLNHIFGTERFAKGDLAKITAFLTVAGSYLKTKVKVE